MEYLDIQRADTKIIARFESDQEIVNGRPAATLRRLGRGQVIKLAFWPKDDSFLTLIAKSCPSAGNLLAAPLPDGVIAVPRTDHSLFVINVTSRPQPCSLRSTATDRITKRTVPVHLTLKPYETLWLEGQSAAAPKGAAAGVGERTIPSLRWESPRSMEGALGRTS
jgi:beta-galactosidase GanA